MQIFRLILYINDFQPFSSHGIHKLLNSAAHPKNVFFADLTKNSYNFDLPKK